MFMFTAVRRSDEPAALDPRGSPVSSDHELLQGHLGGFRRAGAHGEDGTITLTV
jgi:hypothetical protein